MTWFSKKCAICEEKEKRIEELKAQITYLQDFINPVRANPTALAMEAQKILDGGLSNVVELQEPSADKIVEMQKIEREAHMILSGDEFYV